MNGAGNHMAQRIATALIMLSLMTLAGCGDLGGRRIHSYQPLPQNLPSNAAVESPNSRPP